MPLICFKYSSNNCYCVTFTSTVNNPANGACTTPCSGSSSQFCGGQTDYSIFNISNYFHNFILFQKIMTITKVLQ